jgi:hypothetical protein
MAYILIAAGCAGGCLGVTEPCVHDAPLPTLKVRTASASKTKCGFDEYVPSTPPKVYLERALSGTFATESRNLSDCSDGCQTSIAWTYSGSIVYSRPACVPSSTGQIVGQEFDLPTCTPGTTYSPSPVSSVGCVSGISAMCSESLTATTRTLSPSGVCYYTGASNPYSTMTGSAVETLSNEYTTALLISDAIAAATSFTSFATGTVGVTAIASYDLTTDEATATVKQGEYYFELPSLGDATCYKLEWNETFTPESGSPTTTARSYLWDGIETDSPTHSISIPGTQGTWTITDLVASFACS